MDPLCRRIRLSAAWLLVIALGVQPLYPPQACACDSEPSQRCGCATSAAVCCCCESLADKSQADCCSPDDATKTSCPCCQHTSLPEALAKEREAPTSGWWFGLIGERVADGGPRRPVACYSLEVSVPPHNTRLAMLCVWRD